jgi:hypothetical protein
LRAPQSLLNPQRVNFLDGVRGLAALMVLLEHVIKDFLAVVTPEKYDSVLLVFITDGHFAVAIFLFYRDTCSALVKLGVPKI